MTIPLGSITHFVQKMSQDMYGSIDLVVDKLNDKFVRDKTKNRRKIVMEIWCGSKIVYRYGYGKQQHKKKLFRSKNN